MVDFANHPLGRYLKNPGFKYVKDNLEMEVMEFFNDKRDAVDEFIRDYAENTLGLEILLLTSHKFPPEKIDEKTRQYMREILLPSGYAELKLNLIQSCLNINSDFCTLHVRTGDHNGGSTCINNAVIEYINNSLVPTWGSNVVVVSDSLNLKNALASMYGFKSTDFIPIHTGSGKDFSDGGGTTESVLETYLEYLLMSKSKVIYSHSAYPWKSGYSHSCALIYDIPFVTL